MLSHTLPMVNVIRTDGRPAYIKPRDVAALYNNTQDEAEPHYAIRYRDGHIDKVQPLKAWELFTECFGAPPRKEAPRPGLPYRPPRPDLEKTTVD